jgi:hypothetical protein
MPLSSVAGILDKSGNLLRVIVTDDETTFLHHVGDGERLFIVSGLIAQDPPSWEEIAGIVDRVESALAEYKR